MKKAQIIKELFPKATQKELSIIWDRMHTSVFKLAQLDIILQEVYGEYTGSMREFIENKFSKDLADRVEEII